MSYEFIFHAIAPVFLSYTHVSALPKDRFRLFCLKTLSASKMLRILCLLFAVGASAQSFFKAKAGENAEVVFQGEADAAAVEQSYQALKNSVLKAVEADFNKIKSGSFLEEAPVMNLSLIHI